MCDSYERHLCPKCGKPMAEEPEWPGLWVCPGYKIRLNDAPPFRFACTGSELTDRGVQVFEAELYNLIAERN